MRGKKKKTRRPKTDKHTEAKAKKKRRTGRTKGADALTAFVAESDDNKRLLSRLLGDRARLRRACIGARIPVTSTSQIEKATGHRVLGEWWDVDPEGPPPRDLYLKIGYRSAARETATN